MPNINSTILLKLIKDGFDQEEFKTFCMDFEIKYDDLSGDGLQSKVREFILYHDRRKQLPKIIDVGRKKRHDISWEDCINPSNPFLFPFTNQEDELRDLLASFAPRYTVLDAPIGYGKTRLLTTLAERLTEYNWMNVYINISEKTILEDIVALLIKEFCIEMPYKNNKLSPGRLAGEVIEQKWRQEEKKGIVLLIDLEIHSHHAEITPALLGEFILDIISCLEQLTDFVYHNRFRVIIAGRYLSNYLAFKNPSLPFSIRQLSPFTHKVIRDSVRNFRNGITDELVQQISDHLFYLTGGHPGCIAQILTKFWGELRHFNRSSKDYSDFLWKKVIYYYAHEIYEGIPLKVRSLQKTLPRLSVFRYLDDSILKKYFDEARLLPVEITDDIKDAFDMADLLTSNYVLKREGRFLKDAIARRLLTIHLRNDLPENFRQYCQEAKSLCQTRLQQSGVQTPERWVVECLFQSLQTEANNIHEQHVRQSLKQVFFNESLPETLGLFLNRVEIENPRTEIEALFQVLEDDWEFQFTINYYLRTDHNISPYEELKGQVNHLLGK